jgi:hypothetical protein
MVNTITTYDPLSDQSAHELKINFAALGRSRDFGERIIGRTTVIRY